MIEQPVASGRLSKTLAYFSSYIALGLVLASLGPTLPGLATLTGAPLSLLSTIFVTRSTGYLTGALLGGRLFDRYPGHPLLATMLTVMAGCMVIIPLSQSVGPLTGILLILGLAEGALDAGVNTLLVWLYPTGLAPWMNGLHFAFGLGAFASPLVVSFAFDGGSLKEAYWILSALVLPAILFVLVLPSPAIAAHARKGELKLADHRSTVLLIGALLFAAVGAEAGYGNWIFTYALNQNLATEAEAAILTSAFWGAFTFGRLLGIPLAARCRTDTILLLCVLGCAAATSGILWNPESPHTLWAGTIAAGLAVAPMFATILSLADGRMPITGRVTGWFFVGSSAGGMTISWIIGQLFESPGPAATFQIILVDLCLGIAVYVILSAIVDGTAASTRTALQSKTGE